MRSFVFWKFFWDADAGGYEPMLKRRQDQLKTGHPFPQINEEYGYPVKWGGNRRPPSRDADNRRRLASMPPPRPEAGSTADSTARCTCSKVSNASSISSKPYVVYLREGGSAKVTLTAGLPYRVRRYDPNLGIWADAGSVQGEEWTTPSTPPGRDVVYLIEKQ